MKKIEINIPDNLNPLQELAAINKQLAKKLLPPIKQNTKRIGNEVNVIDLQSTIIINRVNKEKPSIMSKCPICQIEYAGNAGSPYYHNYGGNTTKRHTCSDSCTAVILDMLGNRAAKTKLKLKPAIKY